MTTQVTPLIAYDYAKMQFGDYYNERSNIIDPVEKQRLKTIQDYYEVHLREMEAGGIQMSDTIVVTRLTQSCLTVTIIVDVDVKTINLTNPYGEFNQFPTNVELDSMEANALAEYFQDY